MNYIILYYIKLNSKLIVRKKYRFNFVRVRIPYETQAGSMTHTQKHDIKSGSVWI